MSYFEKLPLTQFEFNDNNYIVRDILRRSAFISEYKPLTDLYTSYTIGDGESPSSVALKFYGSPTLHWIILIFNEIHNQLGGWPLDTVNLEKTVKEKYGEVAMFQTRHYEKDGFIVGFTKEFSPDVTWVPPENPGVEDPNIYPVSFLEYESRLNEEKRKITILRPELVREFITQFESSINE